MNQKGAIHLLLPLLLILAIGVGIYIATHQQKSTGKLTDDILQLSAEYKKAEETKNTTLAKQKLNEIKDVASKRKEQLLNKIEENPQEFLNQATLADKREELPTEVKELVEKKVEAKGSLAVVHIDNEEDNSKNKFDYFLVDKNEYKQGGSYEYKLHFIKNPPQNISGIEVKVTGIGIDNNVVLNQGQPSSDAYNLQVLSQPSIASPFGDQKTAVILVNFSDSSNPQPKNKDYFNYLMFDENNTRSINKFYKENSYNKLSLNGDVFGWYTINFQRCNYSDWSSAAYAKAQENGINLSSYPRQVYVFSDKHGCYSGINGIGVVGGGSLATTISWIFTYTRHTIYAHEIGHNIGAKHAARLNCNPSDSTGEYILDCGYAEYGDLSDVMGAGGLYTQFNGPHKVVVGWVPQDRIQTVTTAGIYHLIPLESTEPSIQVLKIPTNRGYLRNVANDLPANYYLSYRQPIGFFDFSLLDNIINGVSIHLWNDLYWVPTALVDAMPQDPNSDALLDGATFYDKIANIWIKQLGHQDTVNNRGGSVTVEIGFGAPPSPTPSPLPTSTPTSSSSPSPTPSPTPISKSSPCEIYGDLNLDGKVTSEDADILSKVNSGEIKIENTDSVDNQYMRTVGDVDADTNITSEDVRLITGYVQGTNSDFPVCQKAKDLICRRPDGELISTGDVTINGKITPMDSYEVLRFAIGKPPTKRPFYDAQRAFADVDGDDQITITDAYLINRYFQGAISTFPKCSPSGSASSSAQISP